MQLIRILRGDLAIPSHVEIPQPLPLKRDALDYVGEPTSGGQPAASWQSTIDKPGLAGLCTTRVQHNRQK